MASNKNQHFVARCVLKPFSLDGKGQAINAYNIDRLLGIQNAPLKNQCSGNYFYGRDAKLEALLQRMESAYGGALSTVRSKDYRLTEKDKVILRLSAYLQHLRTEAASKRAVEMMSLMSDAAFGVQVPMEWRAEMRDAVKIAMLAFSDTMKILDDLKVCLVRNKTKRAFVTSDDPVVLTNRWYQQNHLARGQSSGIGSAGVLLFLPMTPEILCVIYDGDVYNLQNEWGWAEVTKISDIDALNEHQFLSCTANIYFRNWTELPEVNIAFRDALPRRPTGRHVLITAVLDHEDERGEYFRVVSPGQVVREGKSLMHVKSAEIRPKQWPSLIKPRSKPIIFSNGSGTGFVRRHCIEIGEYAGGGYKRI